METKKCKLLKLDFETGALLNTGPIDQVILALIVCFISAYSQTNFQFVHSWLTNSAFVTSN